MLLRTHLIVPLAVIFLTALLFLAHFAHAESVVWNTTFGPQKSYFRDLRYPDGSRPALAGHGGWVQFSDTQDQITYNIRVTDVDTGTLLAPNAQVPLASHVKFEFMPHVYSDISWFTAGGAQDSPYGYWIDQAAPPPIACDAADKVGGASDGVGPQNIYVAHSVNPPAKTLTIPSGMTCDAPDTNGSQVCMFDSAGSYTPTFNWAPTNGNFYLRMTSPRFASGCIGSSNSYYNLSIPAQKFDFPLTVIAGTGNPPATPQLSSGGACTVGAPQTISMVSTDPDGDTLRYGVDWDADGSVDQWVPAAGYVSSGAMQTASRTYAIAGAKTVKVLAQDKNGNSSSWATISFSCAASATVGLNEDGGTGNNNDGSNGGTAQLLPDLDLRVIPSLVRSGNTSKVNWSSTNVRSCTVTGQNGDAWTTLQSAIGGNISKPIAGETTYTLSCIDAGGATLTKSATVRILPSWRER